MLKRIWQDWRTHCLRLPWTFRQFYYFWIVIMILMAIAGTEIRIYENQLNCENGSALIKVFACGFAIFVLQSLTIVTLISDWAPLWYDRHSDLTKRMANPDAHREAWND